ncbi:MAG: acetate--CoA ligase family protein [Acidobacteria bacterium]|nr:acetate--CoA ligase family protein [Acidobacteriota bacterium]
MRPLDPIFKPQSIAVVGASRRPGSIGREIMHNLIEYNFHGKIFPVNPKADYIHSIKAFPTVSAIPDAVDLAIIVVPRDAVLAAVDDCGEKGVKGLIVITAGFGETGEEGRGIERELGERIRRFGMRMVGPNCMGVINTDPGVRMDATFAPAMPLSGRIGFMSQSGALGVAILNIARQLDIGFSYFVSMGNKTDVSGNDLILDWEDDPRTDLILMYLESFGDPRRFVQTARRVTKRKPIVAVKSGRTPAGALAASSHTGALVAAQGLDIATDALFEQSGVIRVDTVEELFDLAMGFSKNPLPKGNRLGILTNAGGPAIMATDTAIGLGLTVGKLSERTTAELRRLLPPEASVGNPVDMTPMSDRSKYDACARVMLEDEGVDSLLVVFVPPMMISAMEIVLGLEELRRQFPKPVVGVMMAPEEFFKELNEKHPGHMAIYLFPESAVRALAALERYRQWRERPEGKVRQFEVNRAAAAELLEEVSRQGRQQLTAAEGLRLLGVYGIPAARSVTASHLAELTERARGFPFPAALKMIAPDIVHKTEVGGVALDLRTSEELIAAARRMIESMGSHRPRQETSAAPHSFLLQEYVRGGREVILGMTKVPNFGPFVMFGLGGVYVETLKDVVFRVPPLTDLEAEEMIRQIRGYRLLEGVRDEKPIDFPALAEMLERFSQLVEDFPQIEEIEVNPFLVFPQGKDFRAVDARVRLKEEGP